MGFVILVSEIVLDSRTPLDVVDSLLQNSSSKGKVNADPTVLVIVPDGLSANHLRSYILKSNNPNAIHDLCITTFEELALQIASGRELIDSELLRLVITSCVMRMNDALSRKVQGILADLKQPDSSPVIDSIISELDEYTGFVNPRFQDRLDVHKNIVKAIGNLDPLLLDRAKKALKFYNKLELLCLDTLKQINLDEY